MLRAILAQELRPFEAIGKGVADVYEGALSADALLGEIAGWLEERGIFDRPAMLAHVEAHGEIARIGHYVELAVSDGARFVLRAGDDPTHFVHVHPVRHGPLTFRVRTPTLKTALIAHALSHPDAVTLERVNEARTRVELPPLKDVPPALAALIEKLNIRLTADR